MTQVARASRTKILKTNKLINADITQSLAELQYGPFAHARTGSAVNGTAVT